MQPVQKHLYDSEEAASNFLPVTEARNTRATLLFLSSAHFKIVSASVGNTLPENSMHIATPELKPSAVLKADTYWSQFFEAGVISLAEAERRAQGSLRLKEAYSSDPWYAKKAAREPSFWSRFYATRINS